MIQWLGVLVDLSEDRFLVPKLGSSQPPVTPTVGNLMPPAFVDTALPIQTYT